MIFLIALPFVTGIIGKDEEEDKEMSVARCDGGWRGSNLEAEILLACSSLLPSFLPSLPPSSLFLPQKVRILRHPRCPSFVQNQYLQFDGSMALRSLPATKAVPLFDGRDQFQPYWKHLGHA